MRHGHHYPQRDARRLSQRLHANVGKRITVRGVIIFGEQCPEFASTMQQWLSDAKIKSREHRVAGLENPPQAYINPLKSRNVGTMLVQRSAESQ